MSAYAVIPARGGSKGVPKKNLAPLGGFPLLAYAIAAAKLSPDIERVILSTDSEEIATAGRAYGAEVPFMRPAEYARDDSLDIEWVTHALEWFEQHEDGVPEYLVHLRATTPLRKPADIKKALELLDAHPEATSLRSGYAMRESPYKLLTLKEHYFAPLVFDAAQPEHWNFPRQAFPPAYQPDGYVDILKPASIRETGSIHGDHILAFISEDTGEIDTLADFAYLEYMLQSSTWEVHEYLKQHFS